MFIKLMSKLLRVKSDIISHTFPLNSVAVYLVLIMFKVLVMHYWRIHKRNCCIQRHTVGQRTPSLHSCSHLLCSIFSPQHLCYFYRIIQFSNWLYLLYFMSSQYIFSICSDIYIFSTYLKHLESSTKFMINQLYLNEQMNE